MSLRLAVVAGALATVGLAFFAVVAFLSAFFVEADLGACYDEAGRGTFGMLVMAIAVPLLLLGIALAAVLSRSSRSARAAAVGLGGAIVVVGVAMLAALDARACADATLFTDDADGTGVAFVPPAVMALYLGPAVLGALVARRLWPSGG